MIRPVPDRFDIPKRVSPRWGGTAWKGPRLLESLIARKPGVWEGVLRPQDEPPSLDACLWMRPAARDAERRKELPTHA